jgi:hypothetical protein
MEQKRIITRAYFILISDVSSDVQNDDGTKTITIKENGMKLGLPFDSESFSLDLQEIEREAGIIYTQIAAANIPFDSYDEVIDSNYPDKKFSDISGKRGILIYTYQNSTEKSIGTKLVPGQIFFQTASSGFATSMTMKFEATSTYPSKITAVI